ncbi:hypothetical protein [Streptomyces sp. NPDC059378]|uniref:hypothetical protein n=1 Tax=Streptomyces sp. NPDC059378 TaxID=3346815 RepID=UPI0036CDEF18
MGLLSWLTRSGDGSRGAMQPGTRADADAGTTSPAPVATDPQGPAGWRSTPPVQRALSAPMGLVSDPGGFGRRLGAWQDPTVTGPLGHLVSAQAPSGVGHGLAQPTVPVQRTSTRPRAQVFDVPRGVQDPASAWAGEPGAAPAVAHGAGDRQSDAGGSADRPGDLSGTAGPVVLRSVTPAGDTARHPDHALTSPGPAPFPLVPLQRIAVASSGPGPDSVPPAPLMVMRVPSAPAVPAPARPLVVAEPPDVPARELTAALPAVPDEHPGPLAPDAPAEPVADLLAAPGTSAGQDRQEAVVQRIEAPGTAGSTAVREPAPLPLTTPRPGTEAGRGGPDAAVPTAPLVGGVDGTGPAVQPVVQRDVTTPPRPRHRGLGEPLSALPPTALPLPGPAVPLVESPVSPSVPSVPYVSRTVAEPQVPQTSTASEDLHVPDAPAVPDLTAGPVGPQVPSPGGEETAPLLGDTPPLTTDPVDLGTGFPPEPATDVGTEAMRSGPVPGLAPGPRAGSGPGEDTVPGSPVASDGATPPGPVAVQRLDVPGVPSQASPSTGAMPQSAEAGAPLLGDASPLTVSDTVVPEAPGPGEMVTAATPMPMRRLDAVDEATLPGGLSGTDTGAGSAGRGAGPVFPLVAQRSLPLYSVPAPSAESPVAAGPPPAVPVRWEPVGGPRSVPGTGGSAGRARSADTAAEGVGRSGGDGDHGSYGGHGGSGGLGGGPTSTGGSGYSAAAFGHTGAVVQRAMSTGGAAPSARSHGVPGGPGLPGRLGLSGPSAFPGAPGAVLPDAAPQPYLQAFQGPGALGPAVPLQRLAAVPGVAAQPVRRSAPPVPTAPSFPGQAPSASAPPEGSAGAVAVAAGVARWMPDGSVEFNGPSVQRAEQGAPSAEPPADPPAQPEPDGPPAVAPPAPSASADTPEKAGGTGAPKVTDELVRALLAPLSRLLRAELRIERERAGSLIDIRH